MSNQKLSKPKFRDFDQNCYPEPTPISRDSGTASADKGFIDFGKIRNQDRVSPDSDGFCYPGIRKNSQAD